MFREIVSISSLFQVQMEVGKDNTMKINGLSLRPLKEKIMLLLFFWEEVNNAHINNQKKS